MFSQRNVTGHDNMTHLRHPGPSNEIQIVVNRQSSRYCHSFLDSIIMKTNNI
jgi:hypothetical protein